MFGGRHIEMALWNTIGDFFDGSGWTTALSDAGIASTGTVDSFFNACHLMRTRHGVYPHNFEWSGESEECMAKIALSKSPTPSLDHK